MILPEGRAINVETRIGWLRRGDSFRHWESSVKDYWEAQAAHQSGLVDHRRASRDLWLAETRRTPGGSFLPKNDVKIDWKSQERAVKISAPTTNL